MKIFFCGTMVPEEIEYQARDVSAAGNRFQNNMIKNLEDMGHEVFRCSYLGVSIPEVAGRDLRRREEEYGRERYVQKGGGFLRSILEYRRAALRGMDDTEAAICYNIIYAWLMLPLWARKKGNKSIVILADYSESISYQSFWGKLYAWMQLQSMRRFNVVVGLSANIGHKLRKSQRFMLLEGGIDRTLHESFSLRPYQAGRSIVFLYSGLLARVTGVDVLLAAMKQMDRQDVRLIFTGKGELEEEVRRAAVEDGRISYRGHLAYEEYVKQLQETDILVNPRNMSLPENQNNFPSKFMDYLASGKVIVSTRFAGWEKFQENALFCDCDAQAIRICMERAIDKLGEEVSVFRTNREKAKQFEWGAQLERVLGQI